jgi:hypothetical protein
LTNQRIAKGGRFSKLKTNCTDPFNFFAADNPVSIEVKLYEKSIRVILSGGGFVVALLEFDLILFRLTIELQRFVRGSIRFFLANSFFTDYTHPYKFLNFFILTGMINDKKNLERVATTK